MYNTRYRGGTASATSNPAGPREFMIEGLLQPRHLLVILAVALFLFGPKKLPELGKGLAEGIRGLKNALKPSSDADYEDKRTG